MPAGDYYQILNVPPTASPEDIKKAYRRLALQYHPDTATNNNELTAKHFAEIKRAYEVLSNPSTRQTYHYQRFYTSYQSQPVITAQRVLQQSTELAQLVAVLDPYRINFEALEQQVRLLLDNACITALEQANDISLTNKVIHNLLTCTALLPYSYIVSLHRQLTALAGIDAAMVTRIQQRTRQQRLYSYWERYKILAAIVTALGICVCYYLLSK